MVHTEEVTHYVGKRSLYVIPEEAATPATLLPAELAHSPALTILIPAAENASLNHTPNPARKTALQTILILVSQMFAFAMCRLFRLLFRQVGVFLQELILLVGQTRRGQMVLMH